MVKRVVTVIGSLILALILGFVAASALILILDLAYRELSDLARGFIGLGGMALGLMWQTYRLARRPSPTQHAQTR